jgi:hypothetical protein
MELTTTRFEAETDKREEVTGKVELATKAQASAIKELSDLQMAYVGGGSIIVVVA